MYNEGVEGDFGRKKVTKCCLGTEAQEMGWELPLGHIKQLESWIDLSWEGP